MTGSPGRAAFGALCALFFLSSCSTEPDPSYVDFVVQVEPETFVARISDPSTIVHFREAMTGSRPGLPAGPLQSGNGGFNAPWTWHLDPEETRLVEAAIEVCDGRPSCVETHPSDYPTYCPWGARIIAEC